MGKNKDLLIFLFLEKLKAGLGAAGLVAILAEALSSAGAIARILGLSLPVIERLGHFGSVGLAVIVFFIVSFFSDITDAETKGKSTVTKEDDQ